MAKRPLSRPSGEPTVRQMAALQCILDDLQSPDPGTRDEAVRQLCP